MKKLDLNRSIITMTEWFARLALLNLCWLFYSLPLLTIIPATDTVFEVLNQWEKGEISASVFRQFKQNFKRNFKKSYKWGLPLFIVFIILALDLYVMSQALNLSATFQILKYAFYTFSLLLILALLYIYPLMKQIGERHIKLFIISFMLAIGHPLPTVLSLISIFALILVFFIWPAMLFFFGVTGVAWIMTKAVSFIIEKK